MQDIVNQFDTHPMEISGLPVALTARSSCTKARILNSSARFKRAVERTLMEVESMPYRGQATAKAS